MKEIISETLKILRAGGVIVYPTDTIWGLGCDATNEKAVRRVLAIKMRRPDKGLIVLASDKDMLGRYVGHIAAVEKAVEKSKAEERGPATTRPLTVIYPRQRGLAPSAPAANGSMAMRVTTDEFCKRLIEKFGKPIVSTSANFSGASYPVSFAGIDARILCRADYVVNLKQDEVFAALPSRVVRIGADGTAEIIRD